MDESLELEHRFMTLGQVRGAVYVISCSCGWMSRGHPQECFGYFQRHCAHAAGLRVS